MSDKSPLRSPSPLSRQPSMVVPPDAPQLTHDEYDLCFQQCLAELKNYSRAKRRLFEVYPRARSRMTPFFRAYENALRVGCPPLISGGPIFQIEDFIVRDGGDLYSSLHRSMTTHIQSTPFRSALQDHARRPRAPSPERTPSSRTAELRSDQGSPRRRPGEPSPEEGSTNPPRELRSDLGSPRRRPGEPSPEEGSPFPPRERVSKQAPPPQPEETSPEDSVSRYTQGPQRGYERMTRADMIFHNIIPPPNIDDIGATPGDYESYRRLITRGFRERDMWRNERAAHIDTFASIARGGGKARRIIRRLWPEWVAKNRRDWPSDAPYSSSTPPWAKSTSPSGEPIPRPRRPPLTRRQQISRTLLRRYQGDTPRDQRVPLSAAERQRNCRARKKERNALSLEEEEHARLEKQKRSEIKRRARNKKASKKLREKNKNKKRDSKPGEPQ